MDRPGDNEVRLPKYQDIKKAADRIKEYAVRTPLIEHPVLNELCGGRVLLKAENLQRVGAFKFRGAYNKISQIDDKMFPGGVVACSSGNHAQGVAAASTLCGLRSVVVMPSDAPQLKMKRTKEFGAQVITYDRDTGDRDAIALELCTARNAAFVHPFNDVDIIAGQGTVGIELMQQAAAKNAVPEQLLIGASGGGMLSGVSIAAKHANPDIKVYGVEPAGFDDYSRSLKSGKIETNEQTSGSICDALLSPSPGALTFAIALDTIEAGLVVSDEEVRAAVRFAFSELKLVVEPSGAVSLAALMSGKLETKNRVSAAIISGGNVDPALFSQIISAG